MPWKLRLALIAVAFLALPAASARAVPRMPVGFYDDPSFRWSPEADANLSAALAAHATIIETLVDWASVAPTKPAHPLDGNDPAYHLADLDALVQTAEKDDMQVLVTITGTPSWANGGMSPNHPPRNLDTLTQFAQMLASRYNGYHGYGLVTYYAIWNEPNLGLFLTPQYQGGRIVSPAIYAKLFMAAYKGIRAGNPYAIIAAGDTSNRGRDHPTGHPGQDSVAPGLFAQLLAKVDPKLPFAAWATHPYPQNFADGPTERVAFPNVSYSTMSEFGASLAKWFRRPVPIWVTEYGEETKPQYDLGVPYAKQAADAREALKLAAASPYVQMFIWFIFRDSNAQTWFSGLEQANGQQKPSYAAFASTAAGIAGGTIQVAPGKPFRAELAVPFMLYHDLPGANVAVSYTISKGSEVVASGKSAGALQRNETVEFPVPFRAARETTYSMTVTVEDVHGQTETHTVAIETT